MYKKDNYFLLVYWKISKTKFLIETTVSNSTRFFSIYVVAFIFVCTLKSWKHFWFYILNWLYFSWSSLDLTSSACEKHLCIRPSFDELKDIRPLSFILYPIPQYPERKLNQLRTTAIYCNEYHSKLEMALLRVLICIR